MKAKKKIKRANRTAMILVRLKPDERARMAAEAKARGLAISAWLRMVALDILDEKTRMRARR